MDDISRPWDAQRSILRRRARASHDTISLTTRSGARLSLELEILAATPTKKSTCSPPLFEDNAIFSGPVVGAGCFEAAEKITRKFH